MRLMNGPGGQPGPVYAPARDLVHAFPRIAQLACHSLAQEQWQPWLHDYATSSGLTVEDLGRAAEACARFIALSTDPQIASADEAAQKAGLKDLPTPALLVFLQRLGDCALAYFWVSAREALQPGATLANLRELQEAAQQVRPQLTA